MDADDGQRRPAPVVRGGVERVHPQPPAAGKGNGDLPRPDRLDAQALEPPSSERGPTGAHQMISAALAFRPDPIPRQRTRWPGSICG